MIPKSINILRRLLGKVAARQVTVQLVSPHVFEALDKRHACLKDMQGPTSMTWPTSYKTRHEAGPQNYKIAREKIIDGHIIILLASDCAVRAASVCCSNPTPATRKTFIVRSACEQLNSVNDRTMNHSVSKKSSDVPMLPNCPCTSSTGVRRNGAQLLLERLAAQGPRPQSEAAWTRRARYPCEIHHEQRPPLVFTQGQKLHRGCDGVSGQSLREDAWHQEVGHGRYQALHLEGIQHVGGHKRGQDLITNLQRPRSIYVHQDSSLPKIACEK